MNRRFIALLLMAFVFTFSTHAQQFLYPLDLRPAYLSANFGELRPNHFHSGVDFKTERVEGKIVRAIDSGYVSRVQISPTGYGRVLYVTHPNGYTSVYAHLQKIDARVDSAVMAYQYEKQVQRVDLSFMPEQFPVERGQQIGLSGNSGSSGGPHLHFEIRKTENQHTINPMFFYDFPDNARPKIQHIGIYPMDTTSFVNHSQKKQLFETIDKGNGLFVLQNPVTVSGTIAFSVQGYDYMPGQSNVYGYYTVALNCNGKTLYARKIDEIDFATTADINSLIDYEERLRSKRNYERMWVEKNNNLQIYTTLENQGLYQTTQDELAQCEIRVTDFVGNTASATINLKQNYSDSLDKQILHEEHLYNCKDSLFVQLGEAYCKLPKNTFFADYTFKFLETKNVNKRYYSKVYQVITNQSISKKAFEIALPYSVPDSLADKIIIENCKRKSPIMTKHDNGIARASIKSGGTFAVVVDTVAPTIKISQEKLQDMTNQKYILFKMSDNYSGVAKYNAYIDGKWQILDYDAKSAAVFLWFDRADMEFGKKHTLTIVLEDLCHNVYKQDFEFYK